MASWQRKFLVTLSVLLGAVPAGAVVVTGSADTYIDSQNPTTAYGGSLAMNISQHSSGLVRFVSATTALPAGTTSSQIAKATLQLWVLPDSVNNAGSVSIYEVTSTFSATTVTYNTRPSTASSPFATASASALSRYIEIDITPLVKQWVTTPSTNYGVEIRPSSSSPSLDLLIGTKWNTAGSQPPILDITLAGPQGVPGPQGSIGPQGPVGPQGPPGPSVSTGPAFSVCAAGALTPLNCSCTHLLSQIQIRGYTDSFNNLVSNGSCTANSTTPCSTTAVVSSTNREPNKSYYGVCCVCN